MTFERCPTLIIMPSEIMLAMTDVPPQLKNGRVMPVTGIMPIVMPIFSNIWKKNIAPNPAAISIP